MGLLFYFYLRQISWKGADWVPVVPSSTGGGTCERGTATLGSVDSSVTLDQPVDCCLPKQACTPYL